MYMFFWTGVIAFVAALLGSVFGTYIFILYCKSFKRDFYVQLKRNAEYEHAPMKDRREAETTNPNPRPRSVQPNGEPIESFMSAVSKTQEKGWGMLYGDNQGNYGTEQTIAELCSVSEPDLSDSKVSLESPEEDVFAALEEPDFIEQNIVYPDITDVTAGFETPSLEKALGNAEENGEGIMQFAIAPDAVQRKEPEQPTQQISSEPETPPKRKRGRPPKNPK